MCNKILFQVTDVSEGHKYRFRIKAVNAAGQSAASDPTPEVSCKAKVSVSKKPKSSHLINCDSKKHKLISGKADHRQEELLPPGDSLAWREHCDHGQVLGRPGAGATLVGVNNYINIAKGH